jgi:hypothetical protein
MSEAVLAHNLFPFFALQTKGLVPQRGADLLSGGDAGYGVYATADGRYMAVAPLERNSGIFSVMPWHVPNGRRGMRCAVRRRQRCVVNSKNSLPAVIRRNGGISLPASIAA